MSPGPIPATAAPLLHSLTLRTPHDIDRAQRVAGGLADEAGFRPRDAMALLAGVRELAGVLLASDPNGFRAELGLIHDGSGVAVEFRAETSEAFDGRRSLPAGTPFDALQVNPLPGGGSRVAAWMWREPLEALVRGDWR